jgi:3-methyladenine DNA glycosylase Mpg
MRVLLMLAVVIICAMMGWMVYTHPSQNAVAKRADAPAAVLVHAVEPASQHRTLTPVSIRTPVRASPSR